MYRNKSAHSSSSLCVRCEQSTNEGNGLDVWLGRLAMVGFAAAISVEIATGKGLLEVYLCIRFSISLQLYHIWFNLDCVRCER